MPDTNPVLDDPAIVDFVLRRARDTAIVHVRPAAALTKGLEGEEMAEIGLLREAGAVAFTDGARSVTNAQVMRRALTYARDFGALIVHHVEDPDLVGQGVMNEGEFAARLGLPGIPREAETVMLERDMRLVRLTGGRYHAAMISCADSAEIMRAAKARGLPVTCGVSINNLALNENDIGDYRTFLKLSPPLRHEDDRQAMIDGARRRRDRRDRLRPQSTGCGDQASALRGGRGRRGRARDPALRRPAPRPCGRRSRCRGCCGRSRRGRPRSSACRAGGSQRGAPADLIVFDPDAPYVLDKRQLRSRSKNTPFDEARLEGQVTRDAGGGQDRVRPAPRRLREAHARMNWALDAACCCSAPCRSAISSARSRSA